jgi:hypothetical protein
MFTHLNIQWKEENPTQRSGPCFCRELHEYVVHVVVEVHGPISQDSRSHCFHDITHELCPLNNEEGI